MRGLALLQGVIVSISHGDFSLKTEIEKIIVKAEETLQTAKYGFDDLVSKERQRRLSAIRNIVVFGRSVTFVLQNLKTPVGDQKFNEWYEPLQEQMKADVLMKYFVTLRNEILKQGKLPLRTSASLTMQTSDISKLGKQPPGAKGFFIGDQLGGSGWEIELPDGTKEKYYVELPESMASVNQYFSELPVPEDDELKLKPIEQLCSYYLTELERILDSAREAFLGNKAEKIRERRLPPYMRIVK
jgi:hypothetical protein